MNDLILKVNDRIEIISNENAYKSLIIDVEEETLRINLPVYNGDYLVLHKGEKIEINSYLDESRCYNFFCEVLSRGKEGSIIYYNISRPFDITKIQRRNFFRVGLLEEMQYKVITGVEENDIDDIPYKNGLMVDLSAGGAKLKVKDLIKKDDLLLLNLKLNSVEFEVKCEIVRIENTRDKEILCGLKFVDILSSQVEKIVKELFEIIRKRRANS